MTMAYKVNPRGPVRDRTYPSQIAAERPFGATRIHCAEQPDEEATLLGGEHPMHGDEMVERINRQLREE
jgi:hypothetical protein